MEGAGSSSNSRAMIYRRTFRAFDEPREPPVANTARARGDHPGDHLSRSRGSPRRSSIRFTGRWPRWRDWSASPRLIVVTGCDQDDQNIRAIHEEASGTKAAGAQSSGHGTGPVAGRQRQAARAGHRHGRDRQGQSVTRGRGGTIWMGHDVGIGTFPKVLPLFRLSPTVDAVTTNENGRVKGPPGLPSGLHCDLACAIVRCARFRSRANFCV